MRKRAHIIPPPSFVNETQRNKGITPDELDARDAKKKSLNET